MVSQSLSLIQTIRLSGAGQIPEEKFIPISPFIIENEGGIHPVFNKKSLPTLSFSGIQSLLHFNIIRSL
jgi:hypothetical protein